jgi:hypothetical protein
VRGAGAATKILDPEVDRLATLHTNGRTDGKLLAVWPKSHADGSPPTIRVYHRVVERSLGIPSEAGSSIGDRRGHAKHRGWLSKLPCHRDTSQRSSKCPTSFDLRPSCDYTASCCSGRSRHGAQMLMKQAEVDARIEDPKRHAGYDGCPPRCPSIRCAAGAHFMALFPTVRVPMGCGETN